MIKTIHSKGWLTPTLLAGALALAALATALVSQYGFGLAPCPLCLVQRWPYYIGLPLMALALLVRNTPSAWPRLAALLVAALAFEIGVGLGIWHSGVEFGIWEGLPSCASAAAPESLEALLNAEPAPSCTDRTPFLFGLTMANWNIVVSVATALLLTAAAIGATRDRASV